MLNRSHFTCSVLDLEAIGFYVDDDLNLKVFTAIHGIYRMGTINGVETLMIQTIGRFNYEAFSVRFNVANNEPIQVNVSVYCSDEFTTSAQDTLHVQLLNVNEAPEFSNIWQSPDSTATVFSFAENQSQGEIRTANGLSHFIRASCLL